MIHDWRSDNQTHIYLFYRVEILTDCLHPGETGGRVCQTGLTKTIRCPLLTYPRGVGRAREFSAPLESTLLPQQTHHSRSRHTAAPAGSPHPRQVCIFMQ